MKTIKKILALGVLGTIFSLVVFLSVTPMVTKATTTVFTGGQTYYLAGSGITSISVTSISLTSFTIPQTGYELTTADVAGVGGKFYITLEPGKTSKQEFISCTTVTQGSGTSAVLSGCSRGLLPFSPYTASSTYSFTHVGGAPLIISNSPAFYDLFALKGNNETITGNWDYTANVTLDVDCTIGSANDEVCAKGYIDAQIASGVSDANPTTAGKVQIATGLQMASSTQYGSTGAYNVISADNATSTYGATSGLKAVITQNDGKIDSNFIRQSDNFAWSGNNTHSGTNLFTASSTHTATTTFSGDVIGSNDYFGKATDSASTTSGTVTLARNMYFTDFTVANGTTVNTNGYIIFVSGTLTNAGTIRNNGNNASGQTAGATTTTGFLDAGTGGKNGNASGAGTAGLTKTYSLGSAGSAGGSGGSGNGSCAGPGAGGAAGGITAETARLQNFFGANLTSGSEIKNSNRILAYGLSSNFVLSSSAGSGSGGTGANDTGTAGLGGGSGSTGGVVEILAKTIINTGTISAIGGNGGNGTNNSGSAAGGGGGAGGSGGVIVLMYKNLTDTGTISVTGGTGGTGGTNAAGNCGGGNAPSGADGVVGKIYKMKME
jgi:hypothetical protein